MDLNSFADELVKISLGVGQVKDMLLKARMFAKANPNAIKFPLIGAGSVAAWKTLETLKRQRDLGAAMEAQMGQQ